MPQRRKGSPSKRKIASRSLIAFGIIAGMGLLLWQFQTSFGERYWREFKAAGNRALERGNYEWAERMYREALKYAQNQRDEEKMRESYLLLHRLYKAQGKQELAQEMLSLAQELQTGRSD